MVIRMKYRELFKTLTLAVGQIGSKILSLLFIFILSNRMKSIGLVYYSYAYIPFSIFADLSAFGLIPGISALTSKFRAEEKNGNKHYMFRVGTIYSILLGIVFFLLLNLFSHKILKVSLSDASNNYDFSLIITNIRVASYSLFFVPLISFYRGYLQGHLRMLPTALSLIIDNLFRVILVLVFINNPSISGLTDALYFNFYGHASAVIILFLFVYMDYFKKAEKCRALYSIIKASIPFGVVTLFFTFYTFIDSLTLSSIGIKGDIYTAYMFEAIRIVFLPITLAQSIGGFLNPKVNELIKEGKTIEVEKSVKESSSGVLYILIPLIFILKLYSKDIYGAFYESSNNYMVLYHLSDLILYIGFYKVLIGIINALPKFNYIIWATFISIAAKLVLNYVLGTRLDYLGALYATIISIAICIAISYYILYKSNIRIAFWNLMSFILSLISAFISYVFSIIFRAVFLYGSFSFVAELSLFSIVFLSVYSLLVTFLWFIKRTTISTPAYSNLGCDGKWALS